MDFEEKVLLQDDDLGDGDDVDEVDDEEDDDEVDEGDDLGGEDDDM